VRGVSIRSDGAACQGKLEETRLADEDGLVLRAAYRCPAHPAKLDVELPVLAELAHGHRHVAHVGVDGQAIDQVLHRRSPLLEVAVNAGEAARAERRSSASVAASFFVSGIEHIVTGIDHLAFLFGLILLGGRLKSILMMVTAFTLAHSITLALAVLGIWAPSGNFIEPAIALSVAYVGIENWFVKDPAKRWRITFPFGLVHGFGFAGSLGQIALPREQLPVALVTFNLGVEAGQVVLLAVALPLVLLARKHDWFKTTGVRALSAGIALAGVIWFVTRVAGI
jgi:hydrogenase/urease accessory protein HupE